GAWPQVAGRLARADNVRVALGYVTRGEAPLGIVYETDAIGERGVRIVGLFPPASHPPIVYPAAVIRGAAPDAPAFAAFLRSPPARAIFRRHGFRDPGAR
ncbi:MAG: molybdate ABC transporter substrate-binding protein, partial [Sphingomonas sp.]